MPTPDRPSQESSSKAIDHAAANAARLALHEEWPQNEARVRVAVRELCDAARQHAMRPEEIIRLFKQTFATQPGCDPVAHPRTAEALERVIRISIEEYYRGG